MDSASVAVTVLGLLLAWDVLRRFACRSNLLAHDVDDIDRDLDIVQERQGNTDDKNDTRFRDIAVRLDAMDARVTKHGDTLTKMGLKLGPIK